MKKILSLLLILTFVQNNYAQSMRQIMVSMPDSIMPLLTKVNREDCMDYLDSKMKAEVTNRIGSKSEMTKITDDYAQFKLSKSSERTFKLLPTADNDTIICMITTCCGPVCDSKLDFFDNKWNRYNTKILGKNSNGSFRFNGGTTSDSSILGFFKELKSRNKKTIFHPKILMDIDNIPSSKLITGNCFDIKSFFTKTNGYNEYIKHYAALLKDYIDVFLIGSELYGLTSIRDENNNFPAIEELIKLAKNIKEILGPNVLMSYAADYKEYHNIDGWYALDELWSNENIDFIGINAYFPITNLP